MRAGVWAASCERTFGGIGKAKAASEVLQKMHPVRSQGALEGTDNLRITQTKSQKTDEYF